MTHRRTTHWLPTTSAVHGCCSSPCGRTAVATTSIEAGLAALRDEKATRREISSVVDISFDAARHVALTLPGQLASVPLRIHARYQREEILAALDFPRESQQLP